MFEGGVKNPGRPFDLRKLILPIQHFWSDQFDIRNALQKDPPDRILASSRNDQIREDWNIFDGYQGSEGFVFDLVEDIRRDTVDQYESIHSFRMADRHGPGHPSPHRISDQGGLLNSHPIHEVSQKTNVGLRGVRNLRPV